MPKTTTQTAHPRLPSLDSNPHLTAVGARVADGVGVVTILNDDADPALAIHLTPQLTSLLSYASGQAYPRRESFSNQRSSKTTAA